VKTGKTAADQLPPIFATSHEEAWVQVVNRSGGHAELVALPDVGFHGNSHMPMQDNNSLEVADWLLVAWIDRNIERKRPN
jgi:hypothetical protein